MAVVRAKYAGPKHYEMVSGIKVTRGYRNKQVPEVVTIEIGKPVEPNEKRKRCGTDVIWPVLRVIDPPGIVLPNVRYVCRHEIEAGD